MVDLTNDRKLAENDFTTGAARLWPCCVPALLRLVDLGASEMIPQER